jgi:predicted nucleotidyltransferase
MFRDIKDLELFLNQNRIFDVFGIDKLGVFGSFARGERTVNDIDLLVNDKAYALKKKYDIADELKEKSGIKFDIVYESSAEPIILHRAKKDLKYVQKYQK